MARARNMGPEEREIRNGIVDLLCFLSSGRATKEQTEEIKVRMVDVLKVFQKEEATEHVA